MDGFARTDVFTPSFSADGPSRTSLIRIGARAGRWRSTVGLALTTADWARPFPDFW